MTTIAYKDGVIAYDSRLSWGEIVLDNDYEKCHEINNKRFFISGNSTEGDLIGLVKAYETGERDSNTVSLVLDGRDLYLCGFSENKIYKVLLDMHKSYAIGSGEQFAIAAMDMGANAEQAVKQAMLRDTGTGGKVRLFNVKECI